MKSDGFPQTPLQVFVGIEDFYVRTENPRPEFKGIKTEKVYCQIVQTLKTHALNSKGLRLKSEALFGGHRLKTHALNSKGLRPSWWGHCHISN